MSSNPFLSEWLRATNAAAGTWRGFWTAEFARQQAAMAAEWQRQALQFWTQAMTMRSAAPAPVPAEAAAPVAAAPLPEPAPPAAEDQPAPTPRRAPAAKLPVARAATHRVKAQTKRGPARSAQRRGPAATRH